MHSLSKEVWRCPAKNKKILLELLYGLFEDQGVGKLHVTQLHTHLRLAVLILGALQDMMNYSASGGVGEEGLSVVDSEAEERTRTITQLEVLQSFFRPRHP